MRINPDARQRPLDAFEQTDLIIVLIGLMVLGGIGYAGLLVAGERAHRAGCRSNLRRISQALLLYSADFHDSFPDCRSGKYAPANWPWDLSTNLSNDLEQRGVRRASWYCPANSAMNNDEHWEFWRTDAAKVRVVGYPLLLNGVRFVPFNLQCVKAKGDGRVAPDKKELVLDAVAATGGDYARIQGTYADRSSHLDGAVPAGGNISFEDGHLEWRDFAKMQRRFATPGPGGTVQWDF